MEEVMIHEQASHESQLESFLLMSGQQLAEDATDDQIHAAWKKAIELNFMCPGANERIVAMRTSAPALSKALPQ